MSFSYAEGGVSLGLDIYHWSNHLQLRLCRSEMEKRMHSDGVWVCFCCLESGALIAQSGTEAACTNVESYLSLE